MSEPANVVKKAQDYYDSSDADNFYYHVWGGEDIHIGIYTRQDEDIRAASNRTVVEMSKHLSHLKPGSHILDIGAGYGGSARYLAREKGFRVTCLNLSVVQNQRNRTMNQEQGLSVLVDVVDGSFEDLPFSADTFDAVWSQDAILHSGDRRKVFAEVDRVLKPAGDFVFTDPMQVEGVNQADLQPVLDRIHLDTMGSVPTYQAYAEELGWSLIDHIAMPQQLVNHYARVLQELESRRESLEGISAEYVLNMAKGLSNWITAGNSGWLDWGIVHFRKG